ncbi:MAG: hypothetical protein U5R31_03650 [Acidimicrobiia bacterium]|nr:hypothetical protein [Acidimicrobiia bacterium]
MVGGLGEVLAVVLEHPERPLLRRPVLDESHAPSAEQSYDLGDEVAVPAERDLAVGEVRYEVKERARILALGERGFLLDRHAESGPEGRDRLDAPHGGARADVVDRRVTEHLGEVLGLAQPPGAQRPLAVVAVPVGATSRVGVPDQVNRHRPRRYARRGVAPTPVSPVCRGAGHGLAPGGPSPVEGPGSLPAVARIQLRDLCGCRPGDKGDISDLSLFADDEAAYRAIRDEVTAERVKAHFGELVAGEVRRYEVPNVWALKFVMEGALAGGAPRSLRSDNLGKTLGSALLRLRIDVPDDVATNAGRRVRPPSRADELWTSAVPRSVQRSRERSRVSGSPGRGGGRGPRGARRGAHPRRRRWCSSPSTPATSDGHRPPSPRAPARARVTPTSTRCPSAPRCLAGRDRNTAWGSMPSRPRHANVGEPGRRGLR